MNVILCAEISLVVVKLKNTNKIKINPKSNCFALLYSKFSASLEEFPKNVRANNIKFTTKFSRQLKY